MTAIAYRNGVIAGDSRAVTGTGVKYVDRGKVWKARGHLFGASGNAVPDNGDMVEWFFSENRGSMPKCSFSLIVVTPTGAKVLLGSDGGLRKLDDFSFFSVGAGSEVCFGAMEAGATAAQAVAAAIKWHPQCGGYVITRRLK